MGEQVKRRSFSPLSEMLRQSPFEVTIRTSVAEQIGESGDYVLATDYDRLLSDARRLREVVEHDHPTHSLLAATAYIEEAK